MSDSPSEKPQGPQGQKRLTILRNANDLLDDHGWKAAEQYLEDHGIQGILNPTALSAAIEQALHAKGDVEPDTINTEYFAETFTGKELQEVERILGAPLGSIEDYRRLHGLTTTLPYVQSSKSRRPRDIGNGIRSVRISTARGKPLAILIECYKAIKQSRAQMQTALLENFHSVLVITDIRTNERERFLGILPDFDLSKGNTLFRGSQEYSFTPNGIARKLRELCERGAQYAPWNPENAEENSLARLPGGDGFRQAFAELPLGEDLLKLETSGDLAAILQAKSLRDLPESILMNPKSLDDELQW